MEQGGLKGWCTFWRAGAFTRFIPSHTVPGETTMFERKHEKLLPLPRFTVRLLYSLLLAFAVVSVALTIGTVGYHWIAKLTWIDAILNASMILTGMGPVAVMETTASKLFASAYALFSGVVFLSAVGLVLSPVFHRILHRFHVDDSAGREKAAPPKPRD